MSLSTRDRSIALLMALFLIVSALFSIVLFRFNALESLITIIACALSYLILMLALSTNKVIVKKFITKPQKEIIVEKPVIIERQSEKLSIPKYDFIGSTQTMTYHKNSCRLGKLIKRKYKLSNNDANFFKRNKYKACKICIKKTRKV